MMDFLLLGNLSLPFIMEILHKFGQAPLGRPAATYNASKARLAKLDQISQLVGVILFLRV